MNPPSAASRRPANRIALVVITLAVLCAGCATPRRVPEPSPAPTVPEPSDASPGSASDDPGSALHVVRPGQTAWRIARAYGVPLDEVVRANDLADPSRLRAGDVLQIPGAREPLDVAPHPAPIPSPGNRDLAAPMFPDPEVSLSWPVEDARVVSAFGVPRGGRRHAGIDIDGERGDPVRAADAGTVLYSGSTLRGYGKTIILDHGAGVTTLYAHNSRLVVGKGQRVERGDVIARLGSTGNATGSHCHFEVRIHDVPVDPMNHLGRTVAARAP